MGNLHIKLVVGGAKLSLVWFFSLAFSGAVVRVELPELLGTGAVRAAVGVEAVGGREDVAGGHQHAAAVRVHSAVCSE